MGWFGRRMAAAAARMTRGPVRVGFATRRDWPDGTHDLAGFYPTEALAGWFALGDRRYWRRGPWRPVSYAVVEVSGNDFALHARRRGCRAPDCPAAAETAPPVRAAADDSGVAR